MLFRSGLGADTMIGGNGNDTLVVDNVADAVVEYTGGGVDTVQTGLSYVLLSNVERLTLTGTANANGTGNADSNLINGNAGDNVLYGGAGGNDILAGGAGNDTYVIDSVGDTVTELVNAGSDTVRSAIDYTLGGGTWIITGCC